MLKSASMVMDRAREAAKKRLPVVAVAGGEDADVLKAVCDAQREGYVRAHVVGSATKIRDNLAKMEMKESDVEISDADSVKAAVAKAVELCSQGHCHILMKGKVPTPDLMKAVLSPKAGLRVGKLLSHCAVLEVQGYNKLLSVTDGGVLSSPDFNQKLAMIENAVRVSRQIGVKNPRVALLGVTNEADPDFPSSIEAAALARTCHVRGITPYVEGPLTMATIFAGFPEGTAWESQVVRDPDILVAHSIEEANIAVKAMILLRGATFMGVIAGARVPLSLVSRSDPPRNKMASLALAAVMAGEAVQ